MTPRVSFVPSATETLNVPGGVPVALAMPTVDGGNLDVQISHTCQSLVFVSFGAGAAVGPNAAGNIRVLPGTPVLTTSTAAVLAAAKDQTIQGGSQATVAASTTSVSVWSPYSCAITISRGTASAQTAFA